MSLSNPFRALRQPLVSGTDDWPSPGAPSLPFVMAICFRISIFQGRFPCRSSAGSAIGVTPEPLFSGGFGDKRLGSIPAFLRCFMKHTERTVGAGVLDEIQYLMTVLPCGTVWDVSRSCRKPGKIRRFSVLRESTR